MTQAHTVVFDLDGTLVDTAPDLINALNYVLEREGLPPVPFASARNMIGAGARKLIERGLEVEGRDVSAGGHQPPDRRFHRPLRRPYRRPFAAVRGAGGGARRDGGTRLSLRGLHQQAGMAVEAAARRAGPELAVCRDLRRRYVRRRPNPTRSSCSRRSRAPAVTFRPRSWSAMPDRISASPAAPAFR